MPTTPTTATSGDRDVHLVGIDAVYALLSAAAIVAAMVLTVMAVNRLTRH
jgi:hypothetical protein